MISMPMSRVGVRVSCGLAAVLAAAVLIPRRAEADVISVSFDSLPSAQGWTFPVLSQPESAIFSVDGSVLHQDTTGLGAEEGALYSQQNVVADQPFSITFTGRVTQEDLLREDQYGHFGLGFGAEVNGFEYFIGIGGGFIDGTVYGGPGEAGTAVLSTTIDTSVFHTYVLDVTPAGGGFTLSVDGTQIYAGVGDATNPANNDLFFGDGSSRAHAVGDISQFVYRSGATAAPEPAGWALMLLGFGGLGAILRRRVSGTALAHVRS